jgi:hypothetical protein
MDETEPELQPLKRQKASPEELIHEQKVKELNEKYPLLDSLMCSVLLKCPPDLMEKLHADPKMWEIPDATSTVIMDAITISDPPSATDLLGES